MKKSNYLVCTGSILFSGAVMAQEQSMFSGDGINMALMMLGVISLVACRKLMKYKAE